MTSTAAGAMTPSESSNCKDKFITQIKHNFIFDEKINQEAVFAGFVRLLDLIAA